MLPVQFILQRRRLLAGNAQQWRTADQIIAPPELSDECFISGPSSAYILQVHGYIIQRCWRTIRHQDNPDTGNGHDSYLLEMRAGNATYALRSASSGS